MHGDADAVKARADRLLVEMAEALLWPEA
jgi:hypothetical protein